MTQRFFFTSPQTRDSFFSNAFLCSFPPKKQSPTIPHITQRPNRLTALHYPSVPAANRANRPRYIAMMEGFPAVMSLYDAPRGSPARQATLKA